MAFELAKNIRLDVQSTLGTALTVTALTQANPGVATSTAHGLTDGTVVIFTVAGGMTQLDQQAVRIANSTVDTFELEGLDTTNYSAWTTGTIQAVTAWEAMCTAQNVSMPDAAPERIQTTTLCDDTHQYAYGYTDAPDGSIVGQFDPQNAAVILIAAATKSTSQLAMMVNWNSGRKTLFNANVAGGKGFDASLGSLVTANVSFTPTKEILHYLT